VLSRWKGGAVVVSHDRSLLRGMDRIVELSSLGARSYGGGWDLYAERKAQEAAAAEHDLDHAEREVRRVAREAQVARERKDRRDAAGQRSPPRAGRRRSCWEPWPSGPRTAARARASWREARRPGRRRGQGLRRGPCRRAWTLGFDLPSSGLPEGRSVLTFDDVVFAWSDGTRVIDGLSFRIAGPERVAGPAQRNGQDHPDPPGRRRSGAYRRRRGARGSPAALLDQRAALLDDDQTILENFRRLNPAPASTTPTPPWRGSDLDPAEPHRHGAADPLARRAKAASPTP
jgi:ATPase subunit of ABC transporter with duplicated ATPase domains